MAITKEEKRSKRSHASTPRPEQKRRSLVGQKSWNARSITNLKGNIAWTNYREREETRRSLQEGRWGGRRSLHAGVDGTGERSVVGYLDIKNRSLVSVSSDADYDLEGTHGGG